MGWSPKYLEGQSVQLRNGWVESKVLKDDYQITSLIGFVAVKVLIWKKKLSMGGYGRFVRLPMYQNNKYLSPGKARKRKKSKYGQKVLFWVDTNVSNFQSMCRKGGWVGTLV